MLAGVGLMRLSTAIDRDDERALATIAAALEAGVRLFDTAPSYAHGEADLHHNERLLGRAIRASSVPRSEITIVTKVGLTRRGGDWVPDGRAASIRALALASQEALGVGIDVLLLHCPDPQVKLETSIRALDALREEGVTKAIGVSELGLFGFRRAAAIAPITVVEERVGAFHDAPLRTGYVAEVRERGALFLGHTPLGTPQRAKRFDRLSALAERRGTTPQTLALAWLAREGVIALPGVTRPETARLAALATALVLTDDERDEIARAIDVRPRTAAAPARDGEIVIVMGVQGAGKSRLVSSLPGLRLNRDERGGTMKKLHRALGAALAAGERRVVLDNTYATRALRADVVDLGRQHGLAVRCVFLETPLAEAQINVIDRMLARHGDLLAGDALRRAGKDDPGVFLPTVQHKYLRELEPPEASEGFASIERIPFERATHGGSEGRVVALELVASVSESPLPTLAIGWSPPDAPAPALVDTARARGFEVALCEHGAGPPTCWCRPPLPGLVVRWLRARAIDPTRSSFVGKSPAHRSIAQALGLRWEETDRGA